LFLSPSYTSNLEQHVVSTPREDLPWAGFFYEAYPWIIGTFLRIQNLNVKLDNKRDVEISLRLIRDTLL